MTSLHQLYRLAFANLMKIERNKKNSKIKNCSEEVKAKIIETFYNKIEHLKKLPGYNRAKIKHQKRIKLDKQNKYKNDGTANFYRIPPSHAKIAAETYGEGCKSLTDFLYTCIHNGIVTYASCSGHPDLGENNSYVYFNGSDLRVRNLFENAIKYKLANSINLDIGNTNKNSKSNTVKMSIYVNVKDRDKFYEWGIGQINEKKDLKEDKEMIIEKLIKKLREYKQGTQLFLNISDESIEIHNGELCEEYGSIEDFINKNPDKEN